eukprot:1130540-Rhodomonas_salina.1
MLTNTVLVGHDRFLFLLDDTVLEKCLRPTYPIVVLEHIQQILAPDAHTMSGMDTRTLISDCYQLDEFADPPHMLSVPNAIDRTWELHRIVFDALNTREVQERSINLIRGLSQAQPPSPTSCRDTTSPSSAAGSGRMHWGDVTALDRQQTVGPVMSFVETVRLAKEHNGSKLKPTSSSLNLGEGTDTPAGSRGRTAYLEAAASSPARFLGDSDIDAEVEELMEAVLKQNVALEAMDALRKAGPTFVVLMEVGPAVWLCIMMSCARCEDRR